MARLLGICLGPSDIPRRYQVCSATIDERTPIAERTKDHHKDGLWAGFQWIHFNPWPSDTFGGVVDTFIGHGVLNPQFRV